MTDGPGTPALLPLEDGDDTAATGRASTRRWLWGIGLTVGVNLAVTVAAFIGLTVQYRGLDLEQEKLDLEQDKAITEQVTSAAELISSSEVNAQAAGFRMLRRVAQISPDDREHVVDLAESYLANDRPVARPIDLYTDDGRPVYEANVGTQAAVDVIRDRNVREDPGGPGKRAFRLPGLGVEGVRLHHVVMRDTKAAGCFGRLSEWDGADLTGSNFYQCGFKWARFPDATLREVTFTGAVLEDVVFTNADLTGARLDDVEINRKTVFRGTDLSDVTFAATDLAGANFAGVKSIAGADFSAAIGVDRALNLANAPGAESAIWP